MLRGRPAPSNCSSSTAAPCMRTRLPIGRTRKGRVWSWAPEVARSVLVRRCRVVHSRFPLCRCHRSLHFAVWSASKHEECAKSSRCDLAKALPWVPTSAQSIISALLGRNTPHALCTRWILRLKEETIRWLQATRASVRCSATTSSPVCSAEAEMGEVYRAEDTKKGRTVALKILAEQYWQDETFRTRFQRESRAAAVLQEPHVIPIHDWVRSTGTHTSTCGW
jgi:hypothetical protein